MVTEVSEQTDPSISMHRIKVLSFFPSKSIRKHHQNPPDRNHDRQTASNSIEHFFVRHKTLPGVGILKIIRHSTKIADQLPYLLIDFLIALGIDSRDNL